MGTFEDKSLDQEDNKILNDTFAEFGVSPEVWFNFGLNGEYIRFDGGLSLLEMRAFTEAMLRMERRHHLAPVSPDRA